MIYHDFDWSRVTPASDIQIEELCDADFRETGIMPEWASRFWITRDGAVVLLV